MGFPHLPKGRRQYIPWICPYPTQMVVGGGLPTWTFYQEHWSMAGLAGLPVEHATLMFGTHCHPNVENPKKLARKIHTSFLIPAVRCEASPGQGYTVSSTPIYLTRNMFLPKWSILSGCLTAAFATPEWEAPKDWLTESGHLPYWDGSSNSSHHGISGWVNQPHCPIQSDWRRKVVHAGCNCFGEEVEFGSNWSHP